MIATILNSIGLMLGIIGSVVLFKADGIFDGMKGDEKEGYSVDYSGNSKEKNKKRRIGFLLIMIGFSISLISNWMPSLIHFVK